MTEAVDPPWQAVEMATDASRRDELGRIAAELAAIARSGKVLPGSIGERRTRCGRPSCACHSDPLRLHGPYFQWTRKVSAKTVGRWLSAEQAAEYRAFVDNDRRLRELLTRLEAIGLAALEADPRTRRKPRPGTSAVDNAWAKSAYPAGEPPITPQTTRPTPNVKTSP